MVSKKKIAFNFFLYFILLFTLFVLLEFISYSYFLVEAKTKSKKNIETDSTFEQGPCFFRYENQGKIVLQECHDI